MKINVVNIKDGEHNFDFTEKLEDFKYEGVTLSSDVTFNSVLYKSAVMITLKAVIKGKYILTCDRCLDEYETEFEIPYFMVYKFESDEQLIAENEDDSIRYVSPKTVFIELNPDVIEHIILAIPMKHAPAEKNDVCTLCGRNINELIVKTEEVKGDNPVWDKLKSLKK